MPSDLGYLQPFHKLPLFMRSSFPPGCLPLLLLLGLFLLPLFLADVLLTALAKLGFGPQTSILIALGVFLGGMINLPVKKIPREEQVEMAPVRLFGLGQFFPVPVRRRTYTVIAVNVGGCLIPGAIAFYELVRAADQGLLLAALAAVVINVVVCYFAAQPIPNFGIAMNPFVPAIAAAACGLLFAPDFAPPVAFAAGVLGPLVGADLFHLQAIMKTTTGMASIGGAGTFDGIVLSSLIATLLA